MTGCTPQKERLKLGLSQPRDLRMPQRVTDAGEDAPDALVEDAAAAAIRLPSEGLDGAVQRLDQRFRCGLTSPSLPLGEAIHGVRRGL